MEWSNEKTVAALGTALAVVIGAFGAFYVKAKKVNTEAKKVNTAEWIKNQKAQFKLDDERDEREERKRRTALQEYQDLYAMDLDERVRLRNDMNEMNQHRMDCEKKLLDIEIRYKYQSEELTSVKAQLKDLQEWKNSVERKQSS